MHAHPDLLASFSAALTGSAVPAGVSATAADEVARRFDVYRNNVAAGLTEVLAKRFPVIARLVGDDFFRDLARVYARNHRPQSPVLLAWGDSFPSFLAAFPPLAAYPYMADVARIEVARGRAYHAADAFPIAPELLVQAASDPKGARLVLHPSVQVLRLDHPGVTIWQANQPGQTPDRAIVPMPECALILRNRQFEVPVAALAPGDAAMLGAMLSGCGLIVAATAAASAEPDHDPQPILVRLMQAGAIVHHAKDVP